MKKTSIYLTDDLDRSLARKAAQEGITKAELVRRKLAAAMQQDSIVRPIGLGVFDGPIDLATQADEYLQNTHFGE